MNVGCSLNIYRFKSFQVLDPGEEAIVSETRNIVRFAKARALCDQAAWSGGV